MIKWGLDRYGNRIFFPHPESAREENCYSEMADAENGCGLQLGHEEYIDTYNRDGCRHVHSSTIANNPTLRERNVEIDHTTYHLARRAW